MCVCVCIINLCNNITYINKSIHKLFQGKKTEINYLTIWWFVQEMTVVCGRQKIQLLVLVRTSFIHSSYSLLYCIYLVLCICLFIQHLYLFCFVFMYFLVGIDPCSSAGMNVRFTPLNDGLGTIQVLYCLAL